MEKTDSREDYASPASFRSVSEDEGLNSPTSMISEILCSYANTVAFWLLNSCFKSKIYANTVWGGGEGAMGWLFSLHHKTIKLYKTRSFQVASSLKEFEAVAK